jgi:D-glycero-D-manno-heptose 1,7-bisphosphate phosphatase
VLNDVVGADNSGNFESPLNLVDVRITPFAGQQIARLHREGWFVVCITNQPAAAKQTTTVENLKEIHLEIRRQLAGDGDDFDDEQICWHHPEGTDPVLGIDCDCRKPKPGMLLAAARKADLDLTQSWFIGDTTTDVQAGIAAGVRTILITNPRTQHKRSSAVQAEFVASDLEEAVNALLAASSAEG